MKSIRLWYTINVTVIPVYFASVTKIPEYMLNYNMTGHNYHL